MLRLFSSWSGDGLSSKHHVDTGYRGVSRSHHPRSASITGSATLSLLIKVEVLEKYRIGVLLGFRLHRGWPKVADEMIKAPRSIGLPLNPMESGKTRGFLAAVKWLI
jgi:hypothetical protein